MYDVLFADRHINFLGDFSVIVPTLGTTRRSDLVINVSALTRTLHLLTTSQDMRR